MNKRKRKKWLKQHNKYVNPRECWNLDITISNFVLPRLKVFKKDNNGYPGYGDADTPEKWDEILDKMILGFEYVIASDDWWLYDPKYNYLDCLFEKQDEIERNCIIENNRRQAVIKEGLQLFAKYFQHLWW